MVRYGDMYSRGLIDPSGAVPVLGRGLGYMAPTYLCRSPDSNLRRPMWPRTLFSIEKPILVLKKSDIRKSILAKRDATSVAWRESASDNLARHAVAAVSSGPSGAVAGYWPYKSEADPRPLMADLRDFGRPLALPVIEHPHVIFRRYVEGVDLVDAGFGTLGPDASADVIRPAILLVPLAAFDADCNRIGWGQGHYDRVIERLLADGEPLLTVGIGFSFQQVEKVPIESHDRPLDMVVTEKGIIVKPRTSLDGPSASRH
jgi:5-formyltetrahydrofolate cyclo-ligase